MSADGGAGVDEAGDLVCWRNRADSKQFSELTGLNQPQSLMCPYARETILSHVPERGLNQVQIHCLCPSPVFSCFLQANGCFFVLKET